MQRPETSRATAGPGENILMGPNWGENFRTLLFKMAHFGVLCIFDRRRAPKRRWPGVIFPSLNGPANDKHFTASDR